MSLLDGKLYLTEAEVSQLTGIARQTLRNWRSTCKGPCYVRVGSKMIRYPAEEVERFMRERFVSPRKLGEEDNRDDQQ